VRAEDKAALAVATGQGGIEIARAVEGVHRAVLARSYGLVGTVGKIPLQVQDGVTSGVYAAVREVLGRVAAASSRVLATRGSGPDDAAAGPGGTERWRAALCSGVGDHLEHASSPLAMAMSLRRDDAVVAPTARSLAHSYPRATRGVVVFLHGLGMTEHAWNPGPAGSRAAPGAPEVCGYSERLAADLGMTAVYTRYNTGLHVSTNGRLFGELLARVVRCWPVPVTRIVLIGHSMGGLVVRSACHAGVEEGAAWVPLISDLVTLGSPHHGAPLEQLANAVSLALDVAPESRPLAQLLDRRSAGIKDLRFGYLTEDAWQRLPPAAVRDGADDVPLLATARHHFVAATVWRHPHGVLADLIGDLMVLPASATGQKSTARRSCFPVGAAHRVARVSHRALLTHPEVYAVLRDRLLRPAGAS
jgi:pimeloyl-ACP methyl ester carboxylesterase